MGTLIGLLVCVAIIDYIINGIKIYANINLNDETDYDDDEI